MHELTHVSIFLLAHSQNTNYVNTTFLILNGGTLTKVNQPNMYDSSETLHFYSKCWNSPICTLWHTYEISCTMNGVQGWSNPMFPDVYLKEPRSILYLIRCNCAYKKTIYLFRDILWKWSVLVAQCNLSNPWLQADWKSKDLDGDGIIDKEELRALASVSARVQLRFYQY